MESVQLLVDSAWQAIAVRDLDTAMGYAKEAHQKSPHSPDVQHVLGLLASRDNQHEIALQLLQQSINAGGKTARKLKDMAEALFAAGYAEQALDPLNEAVVLSGADSQVSGLKSAIMLDLEQWELAAQAASEAMAQNADSVSWHLNAAFALLMQHDYALGFKYLTARDINHQSGSRCPVYFNTEPTDIYLIAEQGLGDTLFYLRYVKPLTARGWKFHISAEKKLVPILNSTNLFESVNDLDPLVGNYFWLNVADLALMSIQCGIEDEPPPLALTPDQALVEKYREQLSAIGPPPYIGATWRAGPISKTSKQGLRLLDKSIAPELLGRALSQSKATVVNLQRLPDPKEQEAFTDAVGQPVADFSAINNNLPGMLALLFILDEYVAVSNTNVHLRESLGLTSQVFVSRPFQDWRWGYEGFNSVWYPNSHIYRQGKDKNWQPLLDQLGQKLKTKQQHSAADAVDNVFGSKKSQNNSLEESALATNKQLLEKGWRVVSEDIPKAISYAQQVLKDSPADANALHLLGWAAVQDLNFKLGLSVLSKAVELLPQNGNICRDYIRVHVLDNQPQKAIQIAQTLLQHPKLWAKGVIYYALATAYLGLGEDERALESLEECLRLIPDHIDALSAAGMVMLRLGEGYARLGFKASSGRVEARNEIDRSIWICPILCGDVSGLEVLVVRSMGLGDELSYLRYLPYLIEAGVKVTYWCGAKLLPVLDRLPYPIDLVPDTEPIPNVEAFDLAFIVHELPMAVEHLGAPEIADPLPLIPDAEKLEKWKAWLNGQGSGPYIGFNWRAGVAASTKGQAGYMKLSKAVDPELFANSLSGIKATWISLQRNVTKSELTIFESTLGSQVSDAAGITDDLDDLLCLLSLLDENIGVSNTNMHMRAGIGKASMVLVNFPSNDWRWGNHNKQSCWFKLSEIYRQSKDESWTSALTELRTHLMQKYGQDENSRTTQVDINQSHTASNTIIWVTGGEIKKTDQGFYSPLSSAQERVINVAELLQVNGWKSKYLVESVSELMGGWQDKTPQQGDVVVFSKVFTDHAVTLIQDAKARGAFVLMDVFNDFSSQPARDQHQKKLMSMADVVVSSNELKSKWKALNQPVQLYSDNVTEQMTKSAKQSILEDWLSLLNGLSVNAVKFEGAINQTLPDSAKGFVKKSLTKRVIWIAAGEVSISGDRVDSPLASTRYRVLIPAANIGPLGWQSQVVNERDLVSAGWGGFSIEPGDVLIVSKVFNPGVVHHIEYAKNQGCRLIVDYCDNHFDRNDSLGELHNQLLSMADLVTTCSKELQRLIKSKVDLPVKFITDSFESNKSPALLDIHQPIKLVWFGSSTNLDTLDGLISELQQFAKKTAIELDVVTYYESGDEFAAKNSTDSLSVNYIEWSLNAQQRAIKNADLVVIPTLESQEKNVKSPNRMVEAIWSGKYVIAGHLPAYEPFSPYASVTDDYISAIKWVLSNQEQALQKIQAGQAYIAEQHTPKKIGLLWDSALQEVFECNVASDESSLAKVNKTPELFKYLQANEVARILDAPTKIDNEVAKQLYHTRYPLSQALGNPKIAVYTAIFGGYDTAPILKYIDSNIDYILYTDQLDFDAPKPWQVRVVPAVFSDPQVDARRLKILSNQILPEYDLTVWVDGNFTLGTLTANLVIDIASRAPVALCKHQFRNCIYDEAKEILRRGIDASTPVIKQLHYYQARQFPKNSGLHATSFLVRDHRDVNVKKLNMRWWELLSTHSKRDQLSFDYVRWESNIPVLPLPWNLRDNALYFWGKNGERKHKISARRSNEHEGRALKPLMQSDVSETYQPYYDSWKEPFLKQLFTLNKCLLTCQNTLAPSVLYPGDIVQSSSTFPDPRLGDYQRELISRLGTAKTVLQIGLEDGGHAALLAMYYGFNTKFVIVDQCLSRYKKSGLDFLTKQFSGKLTQIDETALFNIPKNSVDIILVSHDASESAADKVYRIKQNNPSVMVVNLTSTEVNQGAISESLQLHSDAVESDSFTKSIYGIWLKNRPEDLTWRFAVNGKYGFFYSDWLKAQKNKLILIDIGANVGLYSLIANMNHSIEKIYSFEPHPKTFKYLEQNIEFNQAERCFAYPLAISDKLEAQKIYVKPNHSGVATLRDVQTSEGFQESVTINCIDYLRLNGIVENPEHFPIAIKIDVEGHEKVVIETLSKSYFWPQVSNIYYEVDESYLDFQTVELFLKSEGFVLIEKNGTGKHYDLMFERA